MSSTHGHFESLFNALPARPDRRAYRRSHSALLTYVELGEGNGGIALNVSEGGLAITSTELLMSDYFPSVRFQLPRSNVWIETSGQVAWTNTLKKGAGIQFVDLVDSEREKIREWIETKDSAAGPVQGTTETARETDTEFRGVRSASKLPVKDRKLEVLSEADEAKFAGMFPSEKTLASAHESEKPTAEAEPRTPEQNSRNVLRFLERSPERDEAAGAPANAEPRDDQVRQPEAAPALPHGIYLVEGETPRPSDPPKENLLLAPNVDETHESEQKRAGKSELAQPESAKSEMSQNNSAENESLTPSNFLKENPPVAVETEKPSKIERVTAGAEEQKPPAHVFSREADLIQQLELHRRNQATNLLRLQEQAREVAVDRRSGWPLAALVFLSGIACFAVGVGVGNGFFNKLFGHDQVQDQASEPTPKPASLPAATAGENDFAGSSAVAANAQKSVEAPAGNSATTPPSNSADTVVSDSRAASKGNPPAQGAPAEAAVTKNGDGENPSAKDTRQQTETSAIPATADLTPQTQNAQPFSETQGPILVTAPDEASGPFRLTLAEQAVSASATMAISSQRSVLVPAQPGPASSHRPERLQVGVLIFHVDPQVPSAGNQKDMAGTVRVRATIGKGGDVIDVKPISGPAALIPAVVQAVREWRYTVTLLNGQPLGAEEDVVVEFRPKG